MKRAFVDTAGWFAYARADDPNHDPVQGALEHWEGRLVTSNYIFDEVITLIRMRVGYRPARTIGELLRDPRLIDLPRATNDDEQEAWRLFCHHTDKAYSFTDCVSFAMMRRLGIETAITTDKHFHQAGFQVQPAT